MAPSTNFPLFYLIAIQYNMISTIELNVALITAPSPNEDYDEIEATAIPIK